MLSFFEYIAESKVQKLPKDTTALQYGKQLLRFGTQVDQIKKALLNATYDGRDRFSQAEIEYIMPQIGRVAQQRKLTMARTT